MRLLRLLPVTLTLFLLTAPAHVLGAAGGGTGGFGGGGGGGGGGGYSGGGGSGGGGGGSGEFDPVGFTVIMVVVGGVMIVSWRKKRTLARWTVAAAKAADRATAGLRRTRTAEVAGAARVAAEDDPDFAPERVIPEAEALFRDIQRAWDARDVPALQRMVAADMLVEWRRRLDDFAAKGWHNRVSVIGPVGVEYVGITNLAGEASDRVVVRIAATLDDHVVDRGGARINHDGSADSETGLREYWTLARHGDGWMLVSIEQDAEGRHNLTDPVVADPAEDPSMSDQALSDLAVADRVPDGIALSEVADLDFSGPALAAARDMSLSDERFDPGVIEAAARRAVAAWGAAVDGRDDALLEVATPDAARDLLYPEGAGGRHRVVVRGPRVEGITITAVDAAATPATVDVEVRLHGIRFLQDRDTADAVDGSDMRPSRFTERWTMALQAPGNPVPWRVAEPVRAA